MGIFVKDIEKVSYIMRQLGFEEIYNKIEEIGHVVKFQVGNAKIELIQDKEAIENSFHICVDGGIPDFMLVYAKIKYEPFDGNLLVDFVYINDSIYFEFVRDKNDI
jgi:hypothetical protein